MNGDGHDDLVAFFLIQAAGIACGDTSATLAGASYEGLEFTGSDRIETIHCATERIEPESVTGRAPSFGARYSP